MNTRSKYGRVKTGDVQGLPEETVCSPNVERARTGSHITVGDVEMTWYPIGCKSVGDGAWRTDSLSDDDRVECTSSHQVNTRRG